MTRAQLAAIKQPMPLDRTFQHLLEARNEQIASVYSFVRIGRAACVSHSLSAEVIRYAVRVCHLFDMNLHDITLILADLGVVVSDENV